ncbi:MAG TPA: NAD(+) kinase [Spongiibacteraceae bacterium]|jgi:NAD+ kinase|nr:NAD(+) kinase [Spongiibacteraceae bacterium]HUH36981.1 NAD(+) kinase [Spongiibacteraceae bacterium]
MEPFRNIGIIGRDGTGVVESLQRLIEFLSARHLNIILGDVVAALLPEHQLRVCPRKMIGEICDLIIVVGGDGSLLGAARTLARHNAPVLGINRGRLGFLTDIAPDEIEQRVGLVLDGQYRLEQRFLLDATVKRDGEPIGVADALNDVVVNSGTSAKMIEFELFVEGEFVYHQRSDGLIVSTPTGSTAYALSAGGPIMHPRLDAIVLLPMFPHTLSSRPIVVDGNSEIKLIISDTNQGVIPVTCDGQVNMTAQPGDAVYITKKPHKLRLIHPLDHSFYASCRDKLGWNRRPGD